jgi:hypothetical protein
MIHDLFISIVFMGYAIAFMVGLATLFTWVERKQSAIMADPSAPTAVTCGCPSPTSKSSPGA